MVLHGFKSQGSKTRSVDSKFAAPYIGSWPFVISRLRNNQVAFGQSRHQAVGSTDWIVELDPLRKSPFPRNLRCHVAKYLGRKSYIALNRCAVGSMQQPFE